jgi:RNA polymerase sigma-70 factor (ECF subfamily)
MYGREVGVNPIRPCGQWEAVLEDVISIRPAARTDAALIAASAARTLRRRRSAWPSISASASTSRRTTRRRGCTASPPTWCAAGCAVRPAAAALRGLSAADRDALLLHAWAELSYEEIARATNVPLGTVRSRIHRARKRVREHLDPGGDR